MDLLSTRSALAEGEAGLSSAQRHFLEEADARLLAAAPIVLARLSEMLRCLSCGNASTLLPCTSGGIWICSSVNTVKQWELCTEGKRGIFSRKPRLQRGEICPPCTELLLSGWCVNRRLYEIGYKS